MKITISPSTPAPGFNTISIDTNSNEETTTEAVQIALDALIAFGHSSANVTAAAHDFSEEHP